MLDIEAHLSLLVASVDDARARLHERAAARGATVTSDVLRDNGGPRELTLTVRVPSGTSDEFLKDVEDLGAVTSRQVVAKDVGREFHDAESWVAEPSASNFSNRPTRPSTRICVVLGLFGKPGSELGLEPTLGANVAF